MSFFCLVCVALFDGTSLSKKCLNLDDLSWQEKIGQRFPMNCFKICHSYEALPYLLSQNVFNRLLSANKNSSVNLVKLADKSMILGLRLLINQKL